MVTGQDVGSQRDTSGKRRRNSRVGHAGAWAGSGGSQESPAEGDSAGPPTGEEPTQKLRPVVPAWLADADQHLDLGTWLSRPEAYPLVRPYTHTQGRTRSSRYLALEALISTAAPAPPAGTLRSAEHQAIADLCVQPRSVAEVAALLSVPLGVARVLLGDLLEAGAVVVHHTAGDDGEGTPDLSLMGRVLVGLRRL